MSKRAQIPTSYFAFFHFFHFSINNFIFNGLDRAFLAFLLQKVSYIFFYFF